MYVKNEMLEKFFNLNRKPYLELSSKHFRLTTRNSGFVQADVIFGKISYTASVFVQFIGK
jgi:hypothetical protein